MGPCERRSFFTSVQQRPVPSGRQQSAHWTAQYIPAKRASVRPRTLVWFSWCSFSFASAMHIQFSVSTTINRGVALKRLVLFHSFPELFVGMRAKKKEEKEKKGSV